MQMTRMTRMVALNVEFTGLDRNVLLTARGDFVAMSPIEPTNPLTTMVNLENSYKGALQPA